MLSFEIIQTAFYLLIGINVFLFIYLIIKTFALKKINKIIDNYENFIIENFENNPEKLNIKNRFFKKTLIKVFKRVVFTYEQRQILSKIIRDNKIDKYYLKKINSIRKIKRKEASQFLAFVDDSEVRKAIQNAYRKENDYNVKMYLVYAISVQKMVEMIPEIIDSLIDSPEPYQKRIVSLLVNFKDGLYNYLLKYISVDKTEIKKLIIKYAESYPYEIFKNYLMILINNENDKEIVREAVKVISIFHYDELNDDFFLKHKDLEIRKLAIISLSKNPIKKHIIKISEYLSNLETYDTAIFAISTILRESPNLISYVIELFEKENNSLVKEGYAKILSIRIEYFLYKLNTPEKENIKDLLKKILLAGKTSELISFLNKNHIKEIEDQAIPVLLQVSNENKDVKSQFTQYLNDELLEKLNFKRTKPEELPRLPKKEYSKTVFQFFVLLSAVLLVPLIVFFIFGDVIKYLDLDDIFFGYISYYNYFLGFYFIIVNSFYLILLFFSGIQKYLQESLWKLKDYILLYTEEFLPSVSIIAPAFNEEKSIVESVNSLLNLNYPDFELIVVNDGSKDNTLNKLIKTFYLEKIDYMIGKNLRTRPVRGVYYNENIPNLLVIDKENGGKADSLNCGINISKKEYFCGIDADSMIEKDALLKLASLSLDTANPSVAIGGNIIAVNGCKVSKGTFDEIHIPKSKIARFQIVEYMRAFLCGRLGWSFIKSLLIISGAFGLFKKDVIEKAGGYLTESEKYQKNTVGEDMELVVRISSELKKDNVPHKIEYSYNANCWTEVPESLRILYIQRDRWQRGLIDIINFHKSKIFNPKYGTMGLIGLPYYLLFEVFGPLIEFQGYISLFLAIIFGLLNVPIALFLFVSSILLGMSVSLCSLIIAEDEINYFNFKETLVLIIYSVFDVFGFRQFMSFIRFSAFFTAIKPNQTWGKMKRKGFEESQKEKS